MILHVTKQKYSSEHFDRAKETRFNFVVFEILKRRTQKDPKPSPPPANPMTQHRDHKNVN